jgi:hypothetical protein
MSASTLIVVALLSCCIAISAGVDHMENLLVKLSTDYKRFVPPKNVTVSFGINYVCAGLNEDSNILTSQVFERYQWTDPRLTWDPQEYGGIDTIHVPSNLIWVPDNMRLLNPQGDDFAAKDADITASVRPDGLVYWFLLAAYKTYCSRSATYQTDQSYNCYIGFGPWSQGIPSLSAQLLFDSGVELDDTLYNNQCPYVIGDHHTTFRVIKYDCCPEPFPVLEFYFDVHRRVQEEREIGSQGSRDFNFPRRGHGGWNRRH